MPSKPKEPMSPELIAFGTNLARARERANLNQKEMAEQADLERSYISKVEAGKVNISINTASRLATTVGKSLSALLKLPKELP